MASSLPWAWIIETLADFKPVNSHLLQGLMRLKSLKKGFLLKILEEMMDLIPADGSDSIGIGDAPSSSGRNDEIDVSERAVDILFKVMKLLFSDNKSSLSRNLTNSCRVSPSYCTHSKLPHTIPLSRYHWSLGTQNHRDFLGPDPSYNFYYSNSSHPRGLRYRSTPYDYTSHLPFRRDLRHYRHSPKVSTSNSCSFLQSPSLQHWFKNWQELRRHKLTASTFGSAIGFWRGRRVQLWLEKLGLIEPFSGNIATCWNNIQEEVALERYKLITGNSVCFPKFQLYNKAHAEDDWLGASPDGVVENDVYGLPCGGVLEVKCPLHYGEAGQAFPWSRIPLHCMPQAQGLMEILDKNWMDFYVWTPNGSSLFRLQRDRAYWELLRSALSDFWWIHVQPAKELCHLDPTADPFTRVRHLEPAPRHELCSTIVYASKCLVDESRLLVREINGKMQN